MLDRLTLRQFLNKRWLNPPKPPFFPLFIDEHNITQQGTSLWLDQDVCPVVFHPKPLHTPKSIHGGAE